MSALMITRNNTTLILTLANPSEQQILSHDMVQNALHALSNAERDDSVRVIIITGAGKDFCRGRERSNLLDASSSKDIANELLVLNTLLETVHTFPKPVIAAVEGIAQDVGFALALACDFIIAAQSAQFLTSHVKLGLPPEAGISWFLTRFLPRQLTSELLFESKPILAARLQQFGVVNQLVADGSAHTQALRYANRLANLPPFALERVKGLINEAHSTTLVQQFEAERHAFMECLHHHEAQEGIEAYLANKKPRF